MNRIHMGQVGRLKQEKIEEYKELHKAVWPDVRRQIKECSLQNYWIFIKNDLVFAYYEYTGADYDEDMRNMAKDTVTQEWWKLTRPCFTTFDTDSKEAFYEDMEAIFCLD